MIIYTSMPLELVYEGFNEHEPKQQEIEYDGKQMIIEPSGANSAKIVRLISGNPNDYLNPAYTPGSMIYFRPHPPGN